MPKPALNVEDPEKDPKKKGVEEAEPEKKEGEEQVEPKEGEESPEEGAEEGAEGEEGAEEGDGSEEPAAGEDLGDLGAQDGQLSRFEKKLDAVLTELRGSKTTDAKEQEWTLEELRKVEAKIDAGQLDPKYRTFVAEKRSELIANQVAEKTQARIVFNQTWSSSMAQAKKDFPDLKNPKSELFKRAKALVFQDPGYQKYVQMVSAGKKNVDPSTLVDPNLQYTCAERAFAQLKRSQDAQPKGKTSPKDGLEGGGRSKGSLQSEAGQAELDKLEKKAVDSGSPSDWKAYLAKREQVLKAKKR